MNLPSGAIFFLDYQYGNAAKMRHYWLVKGTKIARWDGAGWYDYVTTKDAYYTEQDVIKNDDVTTNSTRLRVPDQIWTAISVLDTKLLSVCDKCRCVLGIADYDRCLVCRGEIEP